VHGVLMDVIGFHGAEGSETHMEGNKGLVNALIGEALEQLGRKV